jgi:aspartate 1-decarboxylase
MMKGKIHRARITEANLHYEGSITLDEDLMDAADILEYEQVHVLDIDNGARLTTYAIAGPRGSGVCCINGAAARLVSKGDMVIILAYANVDDKEARTFLPHIAYVNEYNEITETSLGTRASVALPV